MARPPYKVELIGNAVRHPDRIDFNGNCAGYGPTADVALNQAVEGWRKMHGDTPSDPIPTFIRKFRHTGLVAEDRDAGEYGTPYYVNHVSERDWETWTSPQEH